MVLVLVALLLSAVLVTVTVVTPALSPFSVSTALLAPLLTVTVATVSSADVAVTGATAPPTAFAVAVTMADVPLGMSALDDDSVSAAGTYVTSAPVAESKTVAPVPSLITRFVMVAATLLNEIAG